MRSRLARQLGAAVTLAVLAAGNARAGTHVGIISTVSTSPRTAARINVTGIDGGGATFSVFPPDGGATVQDSVPLSPEFFATSASSAVPGIANLFVGAGGQTALVRVEYTQGDAGVVLEQHSPEEKVVLALPALPTVAGVTFWVPIGDLHRGTTLLIGNPTGSPNGIIVRYGQGADQPPVDVQPFQVAVIPVTVANTQLRIRVTDASSTVIAQLAVDTGKTTVMTYLTPPTPAP